MNTIDLRSDTITQPTPEMRVAMANAEVGDDVYGEDPTINRLQELAAEMLGKEAGLFVTSGTMGNLASILAHCTRGEEVIMGSTAHTFLFEAGGVAALGGVTSYLIPNQADGTLAFDDILSAIRPEDAHQPITRLVALENTHNRCGGVALTAEYTLSVCDLAHSHGLLVHIDGARLFNAAVVQGIPAADLVACADSVTICLSKGLCAPVGSVICGSEEFIHRAHRIRKQLGGGMRQAGILAAAGIVALETMVDRLGEDHAHAIDLARGLSTLPGIVLDLGTPHTNMVFVSLADDVPKDALQVKSELKKLGVLVSATGKRSFRLVTHYWIDEEKVEKAIKAFHEVLLTESI
jgi:threonine aldolase